MKKRISAAIGMMLLVPMHAIAIDARGMCHATANIAKAAMEHRQAGQPYSRVIKLLDDTDTPKKLKTLYVTFTDLAYFEPRYTSQTKQQKAVEAFRDEAYGRCMKEFSDR